MYSTSRALRVQPRSAGLCFSSNLRSSRLDIGVGLSFKYSTLVADVNFLGLSGYAQVSHPRSISLGPLTCMYVPAICNE